MPLPRPRLRTGNLIALRELALRFVAEESDKEDLIRHLRGVAAPVRGDGPAGAAGQPVQVIPGGSGEGRPREPGLEGRNLLVTGRGKAAPTRDRELRSFVPCSRPGEIVACAG